MHLPPPVIWYASVESTNTCLLRKFEAEVGSANTGTNAPFWSAAMASQTQTAGRGQRQKSWQDVPGESLLLSVAAPPAHALEGQSLFSFGIALTVAETLEKQGPGLEIELKWPNDIFAGGKKMGGILIENVLRGMHWQLAVVGLGLNLLQPSFPVALPEAVSVLQLTGQRYAPKDLAQVLSDAVFHFLVSPPETGILERYNARLFRQGALQHFSTAGKTWTGKVIEAGADGRLLVWDVIAGEARWCVHGVDIWG